MAEGDEWCTIESDPGVFTSLIESFGVKNAQLTELWSIDDDALSTLVRGYGKVFGLIFLFKWQSQQKQEEESKNNEKNFGGDSKEEDFVRKPLIGDDVPPGLIFAKQVTTNACATQAILSVLLNASEGTTSSDTSDDDDNLKLGTTLSSLKSFMVALPPDLKGESIRTCEDIRTAHNSFARKESLLFDNSQQQVTGNEDLFHFIAFVPHTDGVVYELDGLQTGPIPVNNRDDPYHAVAEGHLDGEDVHQDMPWLKVARKAIQDRIDKYASNEIKFNLMAVVKDKSVHVQSKMRKMEAAGLAQDDISMQQLQEEIVLEQERREKWKNENERRRHNYFPFCFELIRALAGAGKLEGLKK